MNGQNYNYPVPDISNVTLYTACIIPTIMCNIMMWLRTIVYIQKVVLVTTYM